MGRHRCYTTCRSSLLPMRDESDPRDSSGYTRSTTASDAARSERSHESSKSLLQLPTQRSATPFCHGLRKPEPDAEALDNTDDFCIEVRGAVKDQVARVRLVWKGLADLLHNPGAGRMLCGTSMRNSPPIMRDHEEAVEHPEGQCRHSEEVHRGNGLTMITKKSSPPLGWLETPRCLPHPARDGPFRNIKAKHLEFPMNARRTPRCDSQPPCGRWVVGQFEIPLAESESLATSDL
jgi:hypothetical protein